MSWFNHDEPEKPDVCHLCKVTHWDLGGDWRKHGEAWECPDCAAEWEAATTAALHVMRSVGLGDLKLALATMQWDRAQLASRASADAYIRQWTRIRWGAVAYVEDGGDPRELVIAWAEHGPAGVPVADGPLGPALEPWRRRAVGKRVIHLKESA